MLRSKPRVKYRFIQEHRHEHAVQLICRLLEVSPSGFCEWVKRPLSDRAIEDQRLLVLIRASYTPSGGVYGYRRVHLDLREVGETCGKHRVARIMKVNDIGRFASVSRRMSERRLVSKGNVPRYSGNIFWKSL